MPTRDGKSGCTCPPLADVMRGRADGTREECPVHPTPVVPEGTFIPISRIAGGRTGFGFAGFQTEPELDLPDGFGMGC